MPCQAVEVLDGCGERELVPCTGEAAQSEPCEGEDVFDLAKEAFDFLALGAGELIGLGLHQRSGVVAGFLIDIALDPALPVRPPNRIPEGSPAPSVMVPKFGTLNVPNIGN